MVERRLCHVSSNKFSSISPILKRLKIKKTIIDKTMRVLFHRFFFLIDDKKEKYNIVVKKSTDQ
jgi:hypothetical protein